MVDRAGLGDPDAVPPEPTPLDVLPGVTAVAGLMSDAVAVTDLHRRVLLWNEASARLYGIPAADAVGQPIDVLFDSVVIGESTTSAAARSMALVSGAWRGRTSDRPRIGRLVGQELIIEVSLSRIPGKDGDAIGILSVKRDVTPSVRVERELSTVISLASTTAEGRTRQAAADRALDVLVATTGATVAGITVPGDDGMTRALSQRGAAAGILDVASGVSWAESPAVKAITPPGRVVKGAVALLPLSPPTRRALLDARIRTICFVGLHREDELVGALTLGWDRDDPVVPSDAVILLAAAHVARGLENARLLEEIVRRADHERALAQRLRALDELTRVGGSVTTINELAERSARLINTSLGAAGTAYGLLADDGESYAVTHLADVRPQIAEWLRSARPDARTAFRRWRNGEGSFLEPFEAGRVTAESLALARDAGVTAYAAIPIRVDDEVVGGIAAYFDRPPADGLVDRSTLDRVAGIVTISLSNFRLRERLLLSEARYRSIFEASPDAILVITPEGTVVDANEAAVGLYAADRAWLLGRRATDLARFDLERVRERADGLSVGQTFQTRATGVRADAEGFPAEVEVAAVALDGGRRYLVRVRDLTDQERLQTELVQAQKMEATGQLVSGVAHELNNPLASILGFSQLIRRDPALPADLRHNADLLVEEATRTKRIVQNLLDFARQRPPERHPTSVAALVDSVLALQSYSLGKGSIEAEVDIPSDLPAVELDRGQLQQVLVNLTHNAIYAIKHGGGGRVRIAAATEGPPDAQRVRITVADDGPGVSPEHVERLFEAFFTTKPPSDGTGLGLPVSYGIIASHGGELRYGPSPLGRGAAFTFDLPVRAVPAEQLRVEVPPASGTPATAAPPSILEPSTPPPPEPTAQSAPKAQTASAPPTTQAPPTAAPAPELGTRRLLVLDDEPSIRIFLQKALTALGYEPVVTATGEDAIELARQGPWLAVLCDHQMPGLSGVDVYARIAEVDPALAGRFVMMSGDVLNPTLDAFATSQGVAVLAKPFDLDTLDRTIQAAAGLDTTADADPA